MLSVGAGGTFFSGLTAQLHDASPFGLSKQECLLVKAVLAPSTQQTSQGEIGEQTALPSSPGAAIALLDQGRSTHDIVHPGPWGLGRGRGIKIFRASTSTPPLVHALGVSLVIPWLDRSEWSPGTERHRWLCTPALACRELILDRLED